MNRQLQLTTATYLDQTKSQRHTCFTLKSEIRSTKTLINLSLPLLYLCIYTCKRNDSYRVRSMPYHKQWSLACLLQLYPVTGSCNNFPCDLSAVTLSLQTSQSFSLPTFLAQLLKEKMRLPPKVISDHKVRNRADENIRCQ